MAVTKHISFRNRSKDLCYIKEGNLIWGTIWWLTVQMASWKGTGSKKGTSGLLQANIHLSKALEVFT